MKSTWKIKNKDQDTINSISRLFNLEKKISSLLFSKGYANPLEIEKYLNPRLSFLHSPFQLAGMHEAVGRIRSAIDQKENISIFSDSDLDGITSLTVLYRLFTMMNIRPQLRYLRNDESYGLTREIVDELHSHKTDLLITVDSGIRDVKEIEYARSLGMDVIVTDHHEQDEILPDAIIVNPKVHHCGYPFKHLAGVGVAFKLCHAVLFSYVQGYNTSFILVTSADQRIQYSVIKNGQVEKIVPSSDMEEIERLSLMIDPSILIFFESNDCESHIRKKNQSKKYNLNELLAQLNKKNSASGDSTFGELCKKFSIRNDIYRDKIEALSRIFLEVQLQSSERTYRFLNSVLGYAAIGIIADIMPLTDENRILVSAGIKSLNMNPDQAIAGLVSGRLDAKKIGWEIAPVLNTPGRMGRTDLLVDFFISEDADTIKNTIAAVKSLNQKRREMVRVLFKKFVEELDDVKNRYENLIFVKSGDVPEGLAGLIANMLSDSTGKPSIVVSLPGKNGIVKGSARFSSGNFFSLVSAISGRFEKIGGHENAFGFSVKIESLEDIIRNIDSLLANIPRTEKYIDIDLELEIEDINLEFIKKIALFEPFGQGNEEPLFLTRNLSISSFSRFGKNDNHGMYTFREDDPVSAIGWNKADLMQDVFMQNRKVDLVYSLEANEFRERTSPRMIILDVSYSL